MPVLDARTIQPQPFPYELSKYSDSTIKDADGFPVFIMSNTNQQAISTRDLILEMLNFYTEAEALAEHHPSVKKALDELHKAVEAITCADSEVAA